MNSIIIKKFVRQEYRTPKLTFLSGDTEYTADFTEEWGPEFQNHVLRVTRLAEYFFKIDGDRMEDLDLESVSWRDRPSTSQCRMSVTAFLRVNGRLIGPCILKTPWLVQDDLEDLAEDSGDRAGNIMSCLDEFRLACAGYAAGRQRAQMELFQDEELNIVDVSSAGMLRQMQREGGESKIDNLNQQFLSDNPDIASRILSQKGGE